MAKCVSPIWLRGDKDNPPRVVPCGKCACCISNKRQQWSFRMQVELKHSQNAFFVTLTYDDDHLKVDENKCYSVNKRDVQLWLKRLRKSCYNGLRYYIVSEYGTNGHRPHYHAILFNVLPKVADTSLNDLFVNSWGFGFVDVGSVTGASINYVTKYVFKKTIVPADCKPAFAIQSRRPGIGYQYLDTHRQYHEDDSTRFYATLPDNIKVSLPRYYAEKIYSKYEREQHAARCAAIPSIEDKLIEEGVENPHFIAQERKVANIRRLTKDFTQSDKF